MSPLSAPSSHSSPGPGSPSPQVFADTSSCRPRRGRCRAVVAALARVEHPVAAHRIGAGRVARGPVGRRVAGGRLAGARGSHRARHRRRWRRAAGLAGGRGRRDRPAGGRVQRPRGRRAALGPRDAGRRLTTTTRGQPTRRHERTQSHRHIDSTHRPALPNYPTETRAHDDHTPDRRARHPYRSSPPLSTRRIIARKCTHRCARRRTRDAADPKDRGARADHRMSQSETT